MIRQVVSFALGIAVGVCLYSLLRLRPLSPLRTWNGAERSDFRRPVSLHRPPWVQKAPPPRVYASIRAQAKSRIGALAGPVAQPRPSGQGQSGWIGSPGFAGSRRTIAMTRARPQLPAHDVPSPVGPSEPSQIVPVAAPVGALPVSTSLNGPRAAAPLGPPPSNELAKVSAPPAPASPKVFQTIGYVEKADGQVEAIILQDNQVQVVHVGDLIAERYRVTQVSAESVAAVDVTQGQSPMPAVLSTTTQELATRSAPGPSTPGLSPDDRRPAMEAATMSKEGQRQIASTAPAPAVGIQPPARGVTTQEVAAIPAHNPQLPGNSLGYVEEADGRVEDVMADGDSVRLVPSAPATMLAEEGTGQVPGSLSNSATPGAATLYKEAANGGSRDGAKSSTLKPLGYVVKGNGEFAAIVEDEDEVYVVKKGDRFAGHYQALSVSAEAVETSDAAPQIAPPPTTEQSAATGGWLSASLGQNPAFPQDCLVCRSMGPGEGSPGLPVDPSIGAEAPPPKVLRESHSPPAMEARGRSGPMGKKSAGPKRNVGSTGPATFVFQTLGYVQTQGGEVQAVVADGSQVYLVKQGDLFAGNYRATSVDPVLVLAVKVSPEEGAANLLMAQAESGEIAASNQRYDNWHFSLFGLGGGLPQSEVGATSSPVLATIGEDLIGKPLTGSEPLAIIR